ncbi:MAG: COG2426 family protein [Bacillota bacterium]|jgi:uncharacterized membrane protein
MTEWLLSLLSQISLPMRIIILGAVPVAELRAAIPVAIAMGIPPEAAFILGLVGNLLPIIPLLLIMPWIFRIFERIPFFQRHWGHFIERTRKKGHQVEKYGALGLLIFVAIPLPGTGVWTGSVLSYLMGINFWYSLVALSGGAFFAGIAVTVASVGLFEIYKYLFNLEILAGVILVLIIIWWIIKKRRRN